MILQLAVPLVTVKADWPAASRRLATAMEKGSRPVVAAASFVARFWPELGRFAFVPFVLCCRSIGSATADLVIAPVDPFSPAAPDFAAVAVAVGSAGFAAGSVVVVGLSVAVDSAATVFAAGPDFAVAAADLACSVVGSVCSFAAGRGKGRAVVAISCSLIPRSSF